jgi:hypothetical protein
LSCLSLRVSAELSKYGATHFQFLNWLMATSAMIQMQPEIIIVRLLKSGASLATNNLTSTVATSESQDITIRGTETATPKPFDVCPYYYLSWSHSWSRFLLGLSEYEQVCRKHKGKCRREVNARYHCPAWLSRRLWHNRARNIIRMAGEFTDL